MRNNGLGNPIMLLSAFKEMDPKTRTAVTIGGVVVLGLVGYALYKKFFVPKVDEDVRLMNERIMRIQKEINKRNRSITDNDGYRIALALYEAMNGMGTDEKGVFKQLDKLKTRDDYLTVYVIFGAKPYGVSGEATNIFSKHLYADGLDLHGWFKREFDQKEIDKDLNPRLAKFGEMI